MVKAARAPRGRSALELARVLLVDDDPTSRLTLKTVLEASGYRVDCAASAAEAVRKLEDGDYQLVLSDLALESPEAGLSVLAHARMAACRPATALITKYQSGGGAPRPRKSGRPVLIEPEDIPGLLTKVAEMISERASRRFNRELRQINSAATTLA
jgi:CheY-like chemotaxis protein